MNIAKRLIELSVAELHVLQRAILKEIQHRKELAQIAPPDVGPVSGGKKSGKGGRAAAAKATPVAAKPVHSRRAA